MSKRPWFPLYTADFDRKTKHLSAECCGCYIRLLNNYWDNNGKLDFDPGSLCRIMGIDRRRFNQTWRYLEPFWVIVNSVDGDTLLQERMQEELEKTIEISKAKAESGKKGGQASAIAKRKAKFNTLTHTLTKEHSDNKLSGDDSPEIDQKVEPKKLTFWDIGESIGIPRSLIGKACGKHTETAVAEAIAKTQIKQPADPRSFFTGLLKANPKTGSDPTWLPGADDQLEDYAVKLGLHTKGNAPQNLRNMTEYRNWMKSQLRSRAA